MTTDFKVNDVVEVGGMRGIVRERDAANHLLRVAAGRSDHGTWVNEVDCELRYRPKESPTLLPPKVITQARRTYGRNGEVQDLDPDSYEVALDLPGVWTLSALQRGDGRTRVTMRRIDK